MSKSAVKNNHLSLIIRLGGSLITLFLLIYVLKKQEHASKMSWHDILSSIFHTPWWIVLVVIVLMFISRLAIAGRWYVLLRAAGGEISCWRSIQLTFAGLFASNFLPTTVGGDVVRLAGALRYKCESGATVASLVLDRLVGMFGMLLALPLMIPIILKSGSFWHSMPAMPVPAHKVPAVAWVMGSVVLGALFVLLLVWLNRREKLRNKIVGIFTRIFFALKQGMRHPRSLLCAFMFTGIHMVCFFSIVFLLLQGLQEHTAFGLCAGLWSIVYFVTLLPFSINGWGLQELSITKAFPMVAGVSYAHGLGLALFMRLFTMLASLPGALFLPALLPDVRKAAAPPTPVTENAPVQ